MPDLTELRDELARVCGWRRHKIVIQKWKRANGEVRGDEPHLIGHPFPPNDLNALAAVWPDGWTINVQSLVTNRAWLAYGHNDELEIDHEDEAATEYEARLRLTLAVLKEKAHA